MTCQFGVDALLRDPSTLGVASRKRVGLVTNDAARLARDSDRLSRVALQAAGISIVRLFGPEHGLGARAADGAAVDDGVDALTGLPVVSLYGARMRPLPSQLADLDLLLFDIPDVGARCYTYSWTLYHVLHACADAGVPLIVLDRPNPLGGVITSAEGPLLEPACRSFVGEDDIPLRHSLTLGELARLWQREHVPHAMLDVVPCSNWDASRAWPATQRPWVPTSPAMPQFVSSVWYPGTCLFEATNLSVGRGTDAPFTVVGAPWLDAAGIVETLYRASMPGAMLDDCRFVPTVGPHAGLECRGVRIDLAPHTDPATQIAHIIRPVALGLLLLATIARRHASDFQWAPYPTAANPDGERHLARLVGRADIEDALLTMPTADFAPAIYEWTRADSWSARVAPVRLYT